MVTAHQLTINSFDKRMSFHNLSISVLKVGRQLAGSLAVAAFYFVAISCFSSCLKEEEPIAPAPKGNFTTSRVSLSPDYRFQNYFDLEENKLLSSNLKFDWDIAFDASAEGATFYLNSAKFMFASRIKNTPSVFGTQKDTIGFFKNRSWDAANNPDSAAIGRISDKNNQFWIDKGYDVNGELLGVAKIYIESVTPTQYVLRYFSDLTQSEKTLVITKDTSRNFMYLSFTKNALVNVEPPKQDWDLYFTQYIHTFTNPYLPYLVTGVLINPYKTTVAVDSTVAFDTVDRDFAQKMPLKNSPDGIGYTWKDFSDGIFTVKPKYVFIIKTQRGFFYKLRFIDFYDEKGTKGTCRFEYQRL